MNTKSFCKGFALCAAVAAVCLPAGKSEAALVYDAITTAGSVGSFTQTSPAHMQTITIAGADGPYKINAFTIFGVRVDTTVAAGNLLFITLVSPASTDPASPDVLAGSTLLDSIGFQLPALAAGSYNFALGDPVNAPLDLDVPSRTFSVIVEYTDPTATTLNNSFGGRYTTGTPSVGSNDGSVYVDGVISGTANGIFSGDERVQFNGAATNIRMSIDAVLVPEPGALGLLAIGAGMTLRRRRK